MGKLNSKPFTEVCDLMGCAKIMCEIHGDDSCKQLLVWQEKFGFPENGSFCIHRIQALQDELVKHEKMNGKTKINWVAFLMWRIESEKRNRQQSSEQGGKREGRETNQYPQLSHSQKELDLLTASAAHQSHLNQQPAISYRDLQGQSASTGRTTSGSASPLPTYQQCLDEAAATIVAQDSLGSDGLGPISPEEMRSISSEMTDIAPYKQQLKNCFLESMDKQISHQVRKHCIDWERGRLPFIHDYVTHAEQSLNASEKKTQQNKIRLTERLQMAQLQAREGANGGRNGDRSDPARNKSKPPPRVFRKTDYQHKKCWNCGDPDHMARDCRRTRNKGPGNKGCWNCGQFDHFERDCTR